VKTAQSPNLSFPISFEQMNYSSSVLDDRFTRVKIFIAHEGENRNGAILSKEVLESMIPSLVNVPILGYLAIDSEGNVDFKGHEEKLVVEDGKFKIRYMGHAFGMIPVDHNAHFELRYGSDGVEREYLVCEGLLWKKFAEVEKIFDRDGGFKSQSMELQHSSVKGYTNEQGLFVFTEAKFDGLCILGEGVTPAMISSTIEKFSVADKLKIELSDMLTEFNYHFSAIKEKGDETVEKDNLTTQEVTPVDENPVAPVAPVTFEEGSTTEEPLEVTAVTPAEEAPTDFAKKDDKEDEEDEKDSKDEEKDEDEDEEKAKAKKPARFSRTFELSHDDIRSGIYNALDQHESFKDNWYWVSKVYESHAIVEQEGDGKYFKVNYVKHENAVSIGEFVELFPMFLTDVEKSAVDSSRNNFEALEQEVNTLRAFKSTIEMNEKEQKLASYSSVLSTDEFKSIKQNLANFSVVEIEKEIGFMLLKKNNFSVKTEDTSTNRVPAIHSGSSNPYGSLETYFTKN